MKTILPILLALLSVISLSAQPWSLVWEDEFAGNQLDMSQWNHDLGSGSQYGLYGWGSGELQYYRAENTEVSNGSLKLLAKEEPSGFVDDWGNSYFYSSAKVTTQNKYEFRYGRVEARIKTIDGEGFWPAFWMLPKGINNLQFPGLHCWPLDGEIDIMEQWGSNGPSNVTSGAAHTGDACGPNNFYQYWNTQLSSGSYADDFHRYAVIWKEDTIEWYVDDVKQYTVTPADYPAGQWPYNENEWYVMLNLAITSSGPNANTNFPNQIEIDYVRVYQRGKLGCTDPLSQNYDSTATLDDGSCEYLVDFALDLNCSGISPGSVHVTSSSIGWDCNSYSLSDPDTDGIWSGSFVLPSGTFEYIYCTDNWTESEGPGLILAMQEGAICAPITDFFSYANRIIAVRSDTSVSNTWASCESLSYGCTDSTASNYNPQATCDDGSCQLSTGFSTAFLSELLVFPNPARGVLQLRLRSQKAGPVQIRLHTMIGQVVKQETLAGRTGLHQHSISVLNLPAGTYLLEVETEGANIWRKVMLQ